MAVNQAKPIKDLGEVRKLIKEHKRNDFIFAAVGMFVIASLTITLVILFLDLFFDGYPRFGIDFFTSYPSRKALQAGILSAWVGSSLVLLVTFLVAVPLGIAAGVYLEEYAKKNWLSDLIEINVSNLAGVPSIIYGLLALGLFVYSFDLGQSILTAGLTLALLMLPIVIVSTREAIRAIPVHIREAAFAVGATKWQVVLNHVIPYSYGGILTGVIIGMARAIGETAPVITIGALTFIAFLPPPWVRRFHLLILIGLNRASLCYPFKCLTGFQGRSMSFMLMPLPLVQSSLY